MSQIKKKKKKERKEGINQKRQRRFQLKYHTFRRDIERRNQNTCKKIGARKNKRGYGIKQERERIYLNICL